MKFHIIKILFLFTFTVLYLSEGFSQAKDSSGISLLLEEAYAAFSENDTNKTEKLVTEIVDLTNQTGNDSLSLLAHQMLANVYLNKKQYKQAITKILKAESLTKSNWAKKWVLYINAGVCYQNINAHKKAIEYFEKADNLANEKKLNITNSPPNYLHINAFPFFDDIKNKPELNKESQYIISSLLLVNQWNIQGEHEKINYNAEDLIHHIDKEKFPKAFIFLISQHANSLTQTGQYKKSVIVNKQLMKIFETSNNSFAMINIMNNIGYNHVQSKEYDDAIKAFIGVLSFDEINNIDAENVATTITNIAICYNNMGEYANSVEYFNRAIEKRKAQNNFPETANLYHLVSLVHFYNNDMHRAELACRNAELYAHKTNNAKLLEKTYNIYSKVLQKSNEPDKAIEYYQKYLNIRDSISLEQHLEERVTANFNMEIEKSEKKLKLDIADEQVKDFAIKQLKLQAEKKEQELALLKQESKLTEESIKRKELEREGALQELKITKQNAEAQIREKELKDLQHQKQIQDFKLKEKELKEKEKQKTIELQRLEIEKQQEAQRHGKFLAGLFSIIFILILIGLIITTKKNKILAKQKEEIQQKNLDLAQKNEEINTQKEYLEEANFDITFKNEEITQQKELIEKKNDAITSSINYASRIQGALLPPCEYFVPLFQEHFVFFRPRDIVSGDFYWIKQIDGKTIIAAADCTGHGVPGAFMSMLGISFLNEIVNSGIKDTASAILNELRNKIKASLRQTGKDNEAKDGMDMALCIVDKEANLLHYAGAYNPLYIIRDNELLQFKADKMPIGIYIKEKESFTNHQIELKKNDAAYIFSDGYIDQFGGDNNEKFKTKRFKELLLRISPLPLDKQKKEIEKCFFNWCGYNEQLDDVLVIGFKA